MQIHQVGDRVQLLKVDDPFNNSVGYVSAVVLPKCEGCGREYRITFDGGHTDDRYHRDILVVKYPRPTRNAIAALAATVGAVLPPMVLPEANDERKQMPITTGVLDYFPLAIAEVAKCSFKANEQHNPGQPMHWARDKSTDHVNCMARHLIDRGSIDNDGIRHSAKLAWRALANLQIELENEKKAKQ